MTTTTHTAPSSIYYQVADDTLRYSHNGHPVPDVATTRAVLAARGLLLPNGHVRVQDDDAVTRELTAAAMAAPALPSCGPCGATGARKVTDGRRMVCTWTGAAARSRLRVAGRHGLPPAERCPDCHGSGRGPASLTVGRVTLTPSGHPSSEELEDWYGVHPSDGAGLFLRCYAPASLAPWRDPAQPWEIILWPGWEDGSSIPKTALDGPGYPTRAVAVAALGAACRARYGPTWDHEPHHCHETFHSADGGAWQAECTRCPWRSPFSTLEDPGLHRRHANDHTAQELAAAVARATAAEQGAAAGVKRAPVPTAGPATGSPRPADRSS
jgi:hypothetical protein